MADTEGSPTDGSAAQLRRIVTVVIPAYNDPRLPACLEAVDRLRRPPGTEIEVVVVDNGSDHPARDVVEAYANATFLVEPRRGSYAARNTGLAVARGEIIAFTDSDCRPDEEWLVAAVGRLDADPGLAAVAGRVQTVFEHGRPRSMVEWWEAVEAFPQKRYVSQGFGVTANLVVRREAGEALGWFDAAAQSGGDREFGRRLTASGGSLAYEAGAVVSHPARTTWRELLTKARRTAKGHGRLEAIQGTGPLHLARSVLKYGWENLAVVKRGLTHSALPDASARLRYIGAGLIYKTYWFVDKLRWRVHYGRLIARGALGEG